MILPDISDFDNLIKNNIKTQDNFQNHIERDNANSKSALSTRILNTPLYRLYAEMNKFETLNMIKPIRMNQRKLLDIDHKDKIHHEYTKFAKDCIKSIAEEREKYSKFKEENDNKYNTKIKEIKSNTKRLKDEFNKIRIRRYQEYANYCIFISSK